MEDLEEINEENYKKYGIKIEDLRFVKQGTKFKIFRGFFQEFFGTYNDSFFWIEPLFVDFCQDHNGKVSLSMKFLHADNSKIFDKDYFNASKKHIEVYDENYLNLAEKFKNEYENLFHEKIYLLKRF